MFADGTSPPGEPNPAGASDWNGQYFMEPRLVRRVGFVGRTGQEVRAIGGKFQLSASLEPRRAKGGGVRTLDGRVPWGPSWAVAWGTGPF